MKNRFKILLTHFILVIISLSANAQWQGPGVTGVGDIYFTNDGNVGVGTTIPKRALHIYGRNGWDSQLLLQRHNHDTGFSISADNNHVYFYKVAGIGSTEIKTPLMVFKQSSGNVGIGTTSPSYKLHVNGTGRFTNNLTIDNSKYIYMGSVNDRIKAENGNIGIYPNANLYIGAVVGGVENKNVTFLENGNVGIGTTSPSATLQVGDDGSTSDGVIRIASSGVANKKLQFFRAGTVDAEIFEDTNENFNIFNHFSGRSIIFGTEGTEQVRINANGNVGIGTANPGSFKLAVEGKIGAREIKVTMDNPWPDYVFSKNYKLKSLSETANFIEEEGHLPNIPSAEEVAEKGIELGEMNAKLLEKIEELTLHLIEQNNRLESQQKRIEELENKAGK